MSTPVGFSWIEKGRLGAMGRPSRSDLQWLRANGVDVLISLTEEPPPRRDIDEAGLMLVHVPVIDMTAPSAEDLEKCVMTILKSHQSGLGVAVHCGAGLGRTGVILACYYVQMGMKPGEAMRKVRRLRPGSIETDDQEMAIEQFKPLVLESPPGG